MDKSLKIGVVGAGAIGGVVATMLAHAGYDVEITKPTYDGVMIDNRINIQVEGALGEMSYLVPFVEGNTFTSKKDILLMCTQAHSLSSAIAQTKQYLTPEGIVVAIQNVLCIDDVLKSIEVERFVPMVIDWSSTRENQNEMVVLSGGSMHIGALNHATLHWLPKLQSVLNHITPTIIEENMYSFIMSRFLLYCNTSCMGALTGYKLGVYLKEKQGKNIFINLLKEQLEILKHYNVLVPPYNNQLDYYKFTEDSISGLIYRSSMFKRLINQNGENVSKTLRSLENKRPTEIDYLCCYFVKLAKKVEVNAPYNEAMAVVLKEIENGSKSIILENLFDEKFMNI